MTVTAVCLGAALLLTAVSVGCVGAAASRQRRAWPELPPAVLMAVSTLMMVVPMLLPGFSFGWGSAIVWAAIMLVAGLLALTSRRRRADSAMTAASFVVMATMWMAMSAGGTGGAGNGAAAGIATHTHSGSTVAQFAVALSLLSVLAAATLSVIAVRSCWRKKTAARGIRIATLHHPAMGLSMLLMGLGMTLPALTI